MKRFKARFAVCAATLVSALACGGNSAGGPGASQPAGASAVPARRGPIIVDHQAVAAFDKIPAEYLERAKNAFEIHYTHTSHGSQIVTGMQMLASQDPRYKTSSGFMTEAYGDLGENGAVDWVDKASEAADDYDIVMYSWCGGVAKSSSDPVEPYLRAMEALEREHPNVTFVYMTGHTDKWRVEQLRERNKRIRDYCDANGKVLYDFADIESWDLDGNYHEEAGDDCAWCQRWCSSNACPACDECAHSHCLNCYVKGKAFWWMMARLAGWSGT